MIDAHEYTAPETQDWFRRMVVHFANNTLVVTGVRADGTPMAMALPTAGTRGLWLAAYLESGLGGNVGRIVETLADLSDVQAGKKAEAVSGQNDVYVVIGVDGVELHHDTLEELDGLDPQALTFDELRGALLDWQRALQARLPR